MQIYAEYALIENFCMDFSLLVCAKAATKNPCKYLRVAISSALGACFAVVFPLFGLGGVWAVLVKVAAGLVICLIAGKFSSFKGYLKFSLAFTALTFLLGGALIALFSLTGAEYGEGGGVFLSSVPIGIPLFFAVALIIAVKKIRSKFAKCEGGVSASCSITVGDKSACCTAFYDSGNKVYSGGAPVSIIPPYIAKKLISGKRIKTYVNIHTVAGESKIAVFTADKVEIDDGKNKIMRQNVMLGISPRHIAKVVLHPDLSEVN